jgi:truncated hemoglobin YjbI
MASTTTAGAQQPPTLFAWAGGAEALSRLTRIFYGHVKKDSILAPVSAEMSPQHPEWVAQWLGEVFGGPATYTKERGGYPHMLSRHLGRALTEQQRARWVRLMGEAADEAGLPADPEFRSAFVAYFEWGSRIALANSQPGAQPPPRMPVPHWDWGTAGPPGSTVGSAPPSVAAQAPGSEQSAAAVTGSPSFARDIRPLFTDRDRASMSWAFDLGDAAAAREHADAILDQVAAGRMPCYGAWPAERVAVFRRWIERQARLALREPECHRCVPVSD